MMLYFIPSSDVTVWSEDHVVVLKIDVLTDGFSLMGMRVINYFLWAERYLYFKQSFVEFSAEIY